MVGIIVHGDNHFVVRGPRPELNTMRELVRRWSLIEIGARMPEHLHAWRISTKEFREELEWAWVAPAQSEHTAAVRQLLDELRARGVAVEIGD